MKIARLNQYLYLYLYLLLLSMFFTSCSYRNTQTKNDNTVARLRNADTVMVRLRTYDSTPLFDVLEDLKSSLKDDSQDWHVVVYQKESHAKSISDEELYREIVCNLKVKDDIAGSIPLNRCLQVLGHLMGVNFVVEGNVITVYNGW